MNRARRELQRCVAFEYNAGHDLAHEGTRIVASARLFLAVMDDYSQSGRDGERPRA